jgi:hypothetical protein
VATTADLRRNCLATSLCSGFAQALLRLALYRAGRYLSAMKVAAIKAFLERQPFRPFGVRLNNGAQYTFKDSLPVAATKLHLTIAREERFVKCIRRNSHDR